MKLNFLFFAAATLNLPFASGSIRGNEEHHSVPRNKHSSRQDAPHETVQHGTKRGHLDERLFGLCEEQVHPIENHHGEESAICKTGSSDSADHLTVTSYNIFMLGCAPKVQCESWEKRVERAQRLPLWFTDRNDDIVFFQEMLSNNEAVKDGMLEAGYCGQTTSSVETLGSGLGIFTKFEILETKFIEWCGVCSDAPVCLSMENFADKGVLYAKIKHTDGSIIHAFNAHTESDSFGDSHSMRIPQFQRMKGFIDSLNIPEDEAVFMGGDMNEDYYCSSKYNSDCPDEMQSYCSDHGYFDEMLGILDATTADWEDIGNDVYTYNSALNQLLAAKYDEFGHGCDEHYLTLDYVLYSKNHKKPNLDKSSCHVERAFDPDTDYDLSDHNPLACTYDYSNDDTPDTPIYVTVSSIKCIDRDDNWYWEDDEIVVAIDDKQVWPGPDPGDDWATFDTGISMELTTDDKAMLERNIQDFPVYCLRELDTGNLNYVHIGCKQWDPSELFSDTNALSPSKTLVWDNGPGKYEIVFEFAY